MKALQNAARNREGASGARTDSAPAGENAGAPGELTLEPQEPPQRTVNRGPARPAADDTGQRQAATGQQQAQTVLRAGARPSRPPRHEPGILDAIARRPLVAFSTAAGLFAIGYGIYLYLELTNPGMFASRPSPPPPPPPSVAAAPQPPAPPTQPAGAPAAPATAAPSGAALPGPGPAAAGSPPTAAVPSAPQPASPQAAAGAPASPAAPAPQAGTPSPPAMAAAPAAPAPTAATQSPPVPRATAGPATVRTRAVETPPAAPPAARRSIASAPAAGSIGPAAAGSASSPVAMRGSAPAFSAGGIGATRARAAGKEIPQPPEGVAPGSGPQIVAVDNDVLAGYQALEQGRLDEAERLYRQAMATDPRNVDAMLGLAATLMQQNKADAASQLYMRVLEQDPRNTYAQAGLLNIGGRADPAAAEMRLKQLIAREPTAFLYFTLGNLYSERGQWAAAQSAYFQAHSLAPDNPDYAFNLAVGLEHLSQPKIALDYYRRAVALAKSRGHAQFDSARVENRIRSLEATLAQQP